jgi:hypothetical protein
MKMILVFILLICTLLSGCSSATITPKPSLGSTASESNTPQTSSNLKPRAVGKMTFGEMSIIPTTEEEIQPLGAASCLGQEKDYSFTDDYKTVFKDTQGKEYILSQGEIKNIISPTEDIISMKKLEFKEFESVYFTPHYTDCHAITFYLYGVTAKEAFQFSFQTDQNTTNQFSMAPGSNLQIKNDQLVIEGGRAAGDDYGTRYFFRPDLSKKTMILVKTEKIT